MGYFVALTVGIDNQSMEALVLFKSEVVKGGGRWLREGKVAVNILLVPIESPIF